jgi:xanthine dehydrogenase YagS FAD-binding subunit
VATKPWRALEAEKSLIGQKPTEANFIAAAKTALKDAKPHKYNGFKIELAQRTIVRALSVVGGMA